MPRFPSSSPKLPTNGKTDNGKRKSCGIKIPPPNPVLTLPPETGKKSLSPASKPSPASPPTVRTPSPKGSASTVRRLKETSPMDRRRDRTRWVEVLNCCTAWIPLRKDPHGPEAYGTSGSITLPQPKAARDHCTPAHRTSYQVGRVRLSPPASPQPTAPPPLQPRSQASREKPGLKAISQDFKREALALDKERQQGYCLIPDPVQHEKIRRRMPP